MSQPTNREVHLSPIVIGFKCNDSVSVYPKQSQKYLLYIAQFLEQLERTHRALYPLCRVLNKCISEKALCGAVVGKNLFFPKHNLPETVYESVPDKFHLKIKMQGEKKRFSIVEALYFDIFRSFIFLP